MEAFAVGHLRARVSYAVFTRRLIFYRAEVPEGCDSVVGFAIVDQSGSLEFSLGSCWLV